MGLSLASAVPVVGDILGAGRVAVRVVDKAADLVRGVARGADKAGDVARFGENALKMMVGGKSQKFLRTAAGEGRYIDQFARNVAHEAKTGRASLTNFIKRQIDKDVALIAEHQTKGAVWHFFRSPITGRIGPTGPLAEALRRAGIPYYIH